MKIVVLESLSVNPGDLDWDWLDAFGTVEIYPRMADPEETAARLQGAEVVLINKTPVDARLLDACPQLRLVCVMATGYNVVDCQAARERNVTVCNVPAYGTSAVAQFTFGLLLELCHRIGHHDQLVHQGRWSSCPDFCFWDTPQMELAGKTLGIIGYGKIGQAVGRIGAALGMRILAASRSPRPECPECVPMETVLREADVLTIHCPLTPQTQGLINAETLEKMKDGAILLNTARGPILDETAVAEALRSGKLRGAAVDVAAREPIPVDSPLLTAPNCIITPHMAWAPVESRRRILECTAESIRAFQEGRRANVVN